MIFFNNKIHSASSYPAPNLVLGERLGVINFLLMLFFLSTINLFSQELIIQEIAGTVEIKNPGTEIWVPAQRGQTITGDTAISTGFRSTALIRAGNSLITVRPLTRLGVSELIASDNIETINVNLQTGRVRVDVNPPEGIRTNFILTGPVSVSSVRGTSFEFDIYNLEVFYGTVEYIGNRGIPVLIDAGRISFIDLQSERAVHNFDTSTVLRPAYPITSWAVTAEEAINSANITESIGDSAFDNLVDAGVNIGF